LAAGVPEREVEDGKGEALVRLLPGEGRGA